MRYPVVRMGGLLEDYNRSQQEFREKYQPQGYNQPGQNIIRAPYPAPQSDVTSVPYEYPARPRPQARKYWPSKKDFLSGDELIGFCDVVMSFRRAPFGSQGRQDAIEAFVTLLGRYPYKDPADIIQEVEMYCPWPDFFNALAHPSRAGEPTKPYESGGKPVPSVDWQPPHMVPRPEVPSFDPRPRYRYNTYNPGVPSVDMRKPLSLPSSPPTQIVAPTPIPTTGMIPGSPAGPVPTQAAAPPTGSWGQIAQPSKAGWNQAPPDVATPGAGSNQCPPGQFWDGRQCRGAVNLPGGLNIPGGMAPSGGGVAFPNMGYKVSNFLR